MRFCESSSDDESLLLNLRQFRGLTAFSLIFFQILVRDVVFRDFVRPYLAFIGVWNIFDALHDFSLEGVSFFEQFVNAFRIRAFAIRQTLQIARLATGARAQPFGLE